MNTIGIIFTSVGSVAVVLLVIYLILRYKNKQDNRSSEPPDSSTTKDGTAYRTLSRPTRSSRYRSLPRPTQSHRHGGRGSLTALNYVQRIPYESIQFGDIVSLGNYAEVLRGTYGNDEVAIKRLRALEPTGDNYESILGVIELTSSLQHDCIVKFIGVAWEDPGTVCMVTEFVDGGTVRSLLDEYIKRGYPNGYDEVKLRIAMQIASALTYLHSLNPPIVHGHLTSDNIVLTESHDAKLIDFGVSYKDVTSMTDAQTVLLTPPEVHFRASYDDKSDVYSFGLLLSELDTHQRAYHDIQETTPHGLYQKIVNGTILPHFTDQALPTIVRLAKDCLHYNHRYRPTAYAILDRIRQALKTIQTS